MHKSMCDKPHLQPRHPRNTDHTIKAGMLRRYKQELISGPNVPLQFQVQMTKKKVSSDFFRKVGSGPHFSMLSGKLFHMAGAYDLKALPPNRLVFESLVFGRTRRDSVTDLRLRVGMCVGMSSDK